MASLGTKPKSRGSLAAPYRDLRAHFFKRDYPRGIDRYIDYFGGNARPRAQTGSVGRWTVAQWTVVERIRETG
jgi:hypothetical protein